MLKRFLDIILSLIVLVLLSPIIILTAIAIKIEDSGPIFYQSNRVGKNGTVFKMWKFRSMIVNAENMGEKWGYAKNDPRITKVGNLLRNTSLDEIPQIFNILKGEMSIIGPRPGLKYQVEKYNDFQKQRLLVKPGVTGWAQVNGRHELKWSQKIELDVWYIKNWSIWLDLRIFIKTIFIVLSRKGVASEQISAEMEDFDT